MQRPVLTKEFYLVFASVPIDKPVGFQRMRPARMKELHKSTFGHREVTQ